MSNKVYDAVTDRIIGMLESGLIPWRQEWKNTGNGKGFLPYNVISGKAYRGINTWLLMGHSYTTNGWMTYKQAESKGWQVRKGQKSTPIVYWNFPTPEERENGKVPWMRLYHVFNLDQIDGVPAQSDAAPVDTFDPIESAQTIVNNYLASASHPTLEHGGSSAYFSPSYDRVQMPLQTSFTSPETYYSTLFHEFVHSTGVPARLNREDLKGIQRFGDCDYSREELTAEFGAAFLCAESGITTDRLIENSASYIKHWVEKLKNDKTLCIQAAARSQKAADYILGRKFASESSDTESNLGSNPRPDLC